jgi:N-acyl-D-aspartate/D-glutamate deacylase
MTTTRRLIPATSPGRTVRTASGVRYDADEDGAMTTANPIESCRRRWRLVPLALAALAAGMLGGCSSPATYDVILRHGTIVDGSGGAPYAGDVAIRGDRIAAVGDLGRARAAHEIDASRLAVAPGFVNMLSWANESLIEDGRSQSDIRQGVTLEVMGEGESMGPLNAAMKEEMEKRQSDIKYDVTWSTLGGYLEFLERRGVSTNVASFIGAATPREVVIGYADRAPTPAELAQMEDLVAQAMEEGAMGVASALIYPPGSFAKTDELVALAKVAGEYGGMYISHMRSEGSQLLPAIDELITIARKAHVRAEIYHFKASGRPNWPLLPAAIAKIDRARASGLAITADAYTYTAGATGLNSVMPPWVQEGGFETSLKRLHDPAIRRRIAREMDEPSDTWENLYLEAGSPDRILLVAFKNEKLKPLTGKSLAEVARMRGTSPEETAMDLIVEDDSPIGTIYFLMSEENVKTKMALPWLSFGSDEASLAPAGVFLKSNPHPRAYGNFARVLAKYVRDEKVMSLADAVRKLAALPCANLGIKDRGMLKAGDYADVVVFDPAKIQDHATYEKPRQYATGMVDVFVNGVQVLSDGQHTGATPGRFVRGPGWKGAGPTAS